MALLRIFIVLSLCFNYIQGRKLQECEKQLVWPKEYHVKGERFEFHTKILLPFEIWYSEKYGRSRIDLNGGTVKNYYGPESNNTHAFAIHPVSNENAVSEMKCYLSELNHRTLQLNTTGFKYTGRSTILFEKQVDEWASTEKHEEVFIRNQTLFVYTTKDGYTLPIRNIEKVYINQDRGIIKHSVIDYHLFDFDVTEDDIKIPIKDLETECKNGVDLATNLEALHPDIPGAVDTTFKSYMEHHNKKYHHKDLKTRKAIFEDNWRKMKKHNSKNLGFKLEINEFADRTDDELKYLAGSFDSKEMLLRQAKAKPLRITLKEDEELPENYDSREEGIVTAVKHQGYCGSCWAFATTAAVETAIGKSNGTKLMDLSEQSLVDCGWPEGVLGCQGGSTYYGLSVVQQYGLPTDMEYGGYKAIDGVCKITSMSKTHFISDTEVVYGSATDIKMAIYKFGVVAASVKATKVMSLYSSGIFYEEMDCDATSTNHAIVIVGYGVHEGQDYWLVKNSWGESWGEAGYIRMSATNCFISDFGIVPIV